MLCFLLGESPLPPFFYVSLLLTTFCNHSLLRLRTEVETLIKAHADRITERPRRLTFDIECHEAILRALESGPASISVAKVQAETSHWREELDKRKRS